MTFLVVVPVQDSELLNTLALSFLDVALTDGHRLLSAETKTLNETVDLFPAFVCGFAFTKGGLESLHRYLDHHSVGCFNDSKLICDLSNVNQGEQKERARQFVIEALLVALKDRLVDAKALFRSLAEVRREHEMTQSAFYRIEKFVLHNNLLTRNESLTLLPGAGMPTVELQAGQLLSQRLPCTSVGLSDICLFIDKCVEAHEFQEAKDPFLIATLITAEDGVVKGRWLISKGAIEQGNGAVRLSLRTALDTDEQTPVLELRLLAEGKVRFSTSLFHPDARFAARVDDRSDFSVLAVRTWSYLPGCEAPVPVGACLSVENEDTPPFMRILESEALATAYDVTPNNPHSGFVEELGAILVHPQPVGLSIMKVPAVISPKVSELRAFIRTTSEHAPIIEYAIGLHPVGAEAAVGDYIDDRMYHYMTKWVQLSPLESGELYLPLRAPLTTPHDLFLITRLALQPGNNSWGWATFSKIRVGVIEG